MRHSTVSAVRVAWHLVATVPVAVSSCVKAPEPDGLREGISRRVQECVAGWNSGNLDRFLSLYEDAPNTTVILGGKIVKGLPAIRNSYARAFPPSNPGPMGVFGLDILDVRPLGTDYALVLARFHVTTAAASVFEGVATMIFHRSVAGWRVINDQGSGGHIRRASW